MDFPTDSPDVLTTESTDSRTSTEFERNEGLLTFIPEEQFCYLCEIKGWHDTLYCNVYNTVAKRHVRLKDLRRCKRCIAAKHSEAACFETTPCYFCSADHSSVVCPVRDNKKNRFFQLGLSVPPVLTLNCVFCQENGKHNSIFCTQYQSVDHRLSRIRMLEMQICPKCLQDKHNVRGCKEIVACCYCTMNHHSAICREREAKVELRIRLANGIQQNQTVNLMYPQEHMLCENEVYALSTYAKTLEMELHKCQQIMETQQKHISLLELQFQDDREFGIKSSLSAMKSKPLLIPVFSSSAVPCLFCGNKHATETCKKYKTPRMREIRLIVLNRCTRCLHHGHTKILCRSLYKCPYCMDTHHQVLCNKAPTDTNIQRKVTFVQEEQKRYFDPTDTPSSSCINVQATSRLRRYLGNNERSMPCYEGDDDDAEILSYDDMHLPEQ